MHNFRNLKVWEKSIDFAVECYKSTANFPSEEKFGLISQIRRAAVSVPANIAEGAGRNTDGEFNQFLGNAKGSSFELETLFIIAEKVEILPKQEFDQKLLEVQEIQKMLTGLQKSVKKPK